MKRILAILLLITLIFPAINIPITLASDVEGSTGITGKVTVSATAPSVSFTLYSDSGYTTPTTQITPQTPVYMKITVSGSNPLEEVVVTARLFADNDNSNVGTPPATTTPETYVTFTIQYSGTSWSLTADTGGSSTWNIYLDTNQQQPDPTQSSGDFYVVLVFGKTAREANTGDNAPYADWDIKVEATIDTQTGSNKANGYTVFFYSEVTTTASTVDFGTLQTGQSSVIQTVDSNTQDHFTVTVIANGNYDLKATSDSTWTNTDDASKVITLVTSSPGTGEFSLQIDDETSGSGVPLNPVYVTSDINTATNFVDDGSPTDESGTEISVYMQITLGTNIYTGTYEGTITIHAVDGG